MSVEKLKEIAHRAVQRAISKGSLTQKPCERCGSREQIIAHHEDYTRPLEVHWLCRQHHAQRHQELGWGIPNGKKNRRLAVFRQEGDLVTVTFHIDEFSEITDDLREVGSFLHGSVPGSVYEENRWLLKAAKRVVRLYFDFDNFNTEIMRGIDDD